MDSRIADHMPCSGSVASSDSAASLAANSAVAIRLDSATFSETGTGGKLSVRSLESAILNAQKKLFDCAYHDERDTAIVSDYLGPHFQRFCQLRFVFHRNETQDHAAAATCGIGDLFDAFQFNRLAVGAITDAAGGIELRRALNG